MARSFIWKIYPIAHLTRFSDTSIDITKPPSYLGLTVLPLDYLDHALSACFCPGGQAHHAAIALNWSLFFLIGQSHETIVSKCTIKLLSFSRYPTTDFPSTRLLFVRDGERESIIMVKL